jgi:hypothetical protein
VQRIYILALLDLSAARCGLAAADRASSQEGYHAAGLLCDEAAKAAQDVDLFLRAYALTHAGGAFSRFEKEEAWSRLVEAKRIYDSHPADESDCKIDLDKAFLLRQMGRQAVSRGTGDPALLSTALLSNALRLRMQHLPPNHRHVSTVYHDLAEAHWALNQLDEALRNAECAHRKSVTSLGPSHKETQRYLATKERIEELKSKRR